MKKLFLIISFIFSVLTQGNAQKIIGTFFSYSNVGNDYKFYLETYFAFGYGNGPKIVGFTDVKSNDTIYIKAYYDLRAMYPSVGSSSRDTIPYLSKFTEINYFNVSVNKITWGRTPDGYIDESKSDTLWNQFDTTFDLNATGINEAIASNTLRIYPNPATSTINIPNLAGNQWQEAVVYNSMGQVVLRYKNTKAAIEQVNISHLAAGLYQLVLFDDKHNKPGGTQFVKQTE